ncbi:MAG: Ser-Thr-rich GPI-anchored membrane family protein [Cyclobacteriaceae bacterium]
MKRTILFVMLVFYALFAGNLVMAQTKDTLSEDDIYEMKTRAERTLQDYASAMRELINPRISKAYRDRMINEFITSGNRQIFVDSAYIVYDYEPEHLPPQTMKERPVRIYLNDFNAFYQGTDSQERLSIYYSLRRIHDIESDGENNYYIILDFESQYGDQLPQPRRATLQFVAQGDDWKPLINYVKFNIESEDPTGESPTAREALIPQWRILAEQADTLLQAGNLAEAKVLLDSSLAFNQEPYNAQLLGEYYQQKGELDAAVFSYQQSIALGEEVDSTYQDAATEAKITQIQEQLSAAREAEEKRLAEEKLAEQQAEEQRLAEQRAAEQKLAEQQAKERRLAEQRAEKRNPSKQPVSEVSDTASGVTFEDIEETYKQGKAYPVRWKGGADEPLTLKLYRDDQFVTTIQQNLENSSFTWKVPKSVGKGANYQFELAQTGAEAGVKSGVFSIRRKIPLGIYVGASVGAGAALYFILRGDGTDSENPIEAPPTYSLSEN